MRISDWSSDVCSSDLMSAPSPIFTKALERQIERLASHDCPVIVTGETGSGKELVVRELHRRSARGKHPIFALNCAALPAGLVESAFFGHTRGASTVSISALPGKIRLADKRPTFSHAL